MMLIVVIILIIILVEKDSYCKKLLEENRKLKEELELNFELITKTGETQEHISENGINQAYQYVEQSIRDEKQVVLQETVEEQQAMLAETTEKQHVISQEFIEEQHINIEHKIKKEKEQKNITILVTGAICIVLSAIVFLMSTWNSIPNILKTMVLSFLTLVFFGGSYIAKEKFKLEKTSETFFYIAMAYIPICLLSIYIFKLFGVYLSIYGEGKHIYLMFASLLVAVIYYITYINKNNKYILYGCLLSQMFSVISFSLIFSSNILSIGINLLLYNILLMLITKKDIFTKVYNFIPAVISFFAINILGGQSKTMIFMLALLVINFLILELKNSRKIYSYMFNIFMTLFGIYIVGVYFDIFGTNMSDFIILCYVLLLYIIENIILKGSQRKNLIDSLAVVTLSTMGILHLRSFGNASIIAPYIISTLQIVILINTYIKSVSTGKNITSLLIPIYFIITGISIIDELNCPYYIYNMFAFLTFIVGEIFRKRDKVIHLKFFIISHILIALTCFTVFSKNSIYDVFYAILLVGVYAYSYLVDHNTIFKYLSYITSNFALYTLIRFFAGELEILYYVPMLSTLIIMGIELIYKDIQDEFSNLYLAFSKVISFISIYISSIYVSGEISAIIAIIFAIIIILDNIKHKGQLYNILPLTCVIPAIFFSNLSAELEIGIMLLSLIATTGISLKEKKISVFTIFSGIYLYFTVLNLEGIYLKEILFICWSVVHFLFVETEKGKNVFKFLSYLSILFLYNSIILELGLETYTLFSMLGYVLVTMLTLRTILIKYMGNVDAWEYIIFGFLYFIALMRYSNESDGMLFGILLVAIVFISYIKKYGALFMVSIFAILVNIFALTREFWFSVPWWGYLLAIGTILIGFAIRNEVSDKKSEIKPIDVLKSIKDRIEN